MKAKELNYEVISKTFKYVDGKLFRLVAEDTIAKWRKFSGQWMEINISKSNSSAGYIQVGYKDGLLLAHRVIYCLYHKVDVDPALQIDHENGIRHDNRPENLRLGTHRDNGNNQKIHREGKLVGCSYSKKTNKWHAMIRTNGKRKFIGAFLTEQEAHDAYNEAKQLLDAGKSLSDTPPKPRKARAERTHTNNKSVGRSVCYHKVCKKFMATVKIAGKPLYLGLFTSEPEANEAIDKALAQAEAGEHVETKVEKQRNTPKTWVYWDKGKRKWRADVVFKGKRKFVGRFDSEQAAQEACIKSALEVSDEHK